MRELIKQTRLVTFMFLMMIALRVVPKDCTQTLKWIIKMPLEK